MKPKAFTLVELLVVIAIIALLIGMLIPSIGAARDQSKSLICLSNLKQFIAAAHVYAADNADFYPMALVQKYSSASTVMACWDFATIQSGDQTSVAPGSLWQGDTIARVQQCPSYKGAANWIEDPFTGYNYNSSFIGGSAIVNNGSIITETLVRSARMTDIRSAGTTVVFGDGQYAGGANKFMRSPLAGKLDSGFFARNAGTQGFRHLGRTNVALGDGSTQTIATASPEVPDQPCAPDTGFLSSDNSAYDLK
jgi:prepilin-type N-terminal cleavage/methylation domain-containing protein/prepilin-type processing-associated H-X9-DG protein